MNPEQILKLKGFEEQVPSRYYHTFVRYPFLVIVWFSGKVRSWRLDREYEE